MSRRSCSRCWRASRAVSSNDAEEFASAIPTGGSCKCRAVFRFWKRAALPAFRMRRCAAAAVAARPVAFASFRMAPNWPPPSPAEQKLLQRVGAPPNVRLACQLRPTHDLVGDAAAARQCAGARWLCATRLSCRARAHHRGAVRRSAILYRHRRTKAALRSGVSSEQLFRIGWRNDHQRRRLGRQIRRRRRDGVVRRRQRTGARLPSGARGGETRWSNR